MAFIGPEVPLTPLESRAFSILDLNFGFSLDRNKIAPIIRKHFRNPLHQRESSPPVLARDDDLNRLNRGRFIRDVNIRVFGSDIGVRVARSREHFYSPEWQADPRCYFNALERHRAAIRAMRRAGPAI